MKFKEKEFTPGDYQTAYLFYLNKLLPEVMETLKKLVPKYEKVFDGIGYDYRMHCFSCLIAIKTTEGNHILSYLDPSVRNSKLDAPEPSPEENPILKNFLEFQQSFSDFIERFYLDKYWLKEGLFALLWQLSKFPKSRSILETAGGGGGMVYTGEPLSFNFDGWEVREDSTNFEQKAIAAFENYLRDYINKTTKQAKTNGYKLFRGRETVFDRLEWLVVWNDKEFTYLWELLDHITLKGFENTNFLKDEEIRKKAEDRLRKAFREFEGYDLPVKPFGKRRN